MEEKHPLLESKRSNDGPSLSEEDLDLEKAATLNFSSLEERMKSGLCPASKPTLKSITKRVIMKNKFSSSRNLHLESYQKHRRTSSAFETLQTIISPAATGQFRERRRGTNELMLTSLPVITDDESLVGSDDEKESESSEVGPGESPLLQSHLRVVNAMRSKVARVRPREVCQSVTAAVVRSYSVWIGLPLLIVAWILFYYLGDYAFDFLPGQNSLSWWCLFVARQTVTLDLARLLQLLVCDGIFGTKEMAITKVGSFLKVCALHSKGWPFTIAAWGLLDMILLHGDNECVVHWLHWTGLKIFSQESDIGIDVLNSEIYLRILCSMMVMGLLVSVKRVVLVLHFGRRQLAEFKPKLQELLARVVIVSEIGVLACEADHINSSTENADDKNTNEKDMKTTGLDSGDNKASDNLKHVSHKWLSTAAQDLSDDSGSVRSDAKGSTDTAENPLRNISVNSDSDLCTKFMLDTWEEPANKLDQFSQQAEDLSDLIAFQNALSFLDGSQPFGASFGGASSRNECIVSAHNTYWRLMKLAPGRMQLPFDVLCLIAADDENGREDRAKKKALRKIFRPGAGEELSLFYFISSCDTVYKRLRYVRASIANASVIDKCLERIIDYTVGFMLILVLLTLLKIDAWSFLVPFTSLLVSFSFALGASFSKYIEGLFFIAVRRPYDLGDRIIIVGAENTTNPEVAASWYVEDITICTTTLRNAVSNEVCSVHNWSVANSRIVNCNRSMNANIVFKIMLALCVLEGSKLSDFKDVLENYVKENPRKWESLIHLRLDNIDADNESIECSISFRHRNSWQNAGQIMRDRADLQRYLFDTGNTLGIHLDSPPSRRLLYNGGDMDYSQYGAAQESKNELVDRVNVPGSTAAAAAAPAPAARASGLKPDIVQQLQEYASKGGSPRRLASAG